MGEECEIQVFLKVFQSTKVKRKNPKNFKVLKTVKLRDYTKWAIKKDFLFFVLITLFHNNGTVNKIERRFFFLG